MKVNRLTIRNSDGSVSQPTRTSVEQVFYRLAAYEDTGLEPEEIKTALDGATREFMAYDDLGPIDHLRELVQAEQDGRLVVLPCKLGQDVWYYEFWGGEICPATIIGIELNKYTPQCELWLRIKYTSAMIGEHEYCGRADMALGKRVFLTREEAEAALKKRR